MARKPSTQSCGKMIGTARNRSTVMGLIINEVFMTDMVNVSPEQLQQQTAESVVPKVFAEDEVNRIRQETAKKSFQTGYEKARNELQAQAPVETQTEQPANNYQQAQIDPRVFQEMMDKEMQRRSELDKQRQIEEQGRQILNSIGNKAQTAAKEIPDYDDVTGKVNWGQIPQVLGYADHVDNGGHVLYHLAKNPSHIGSILSLPPDLAVSEIRRLSDSLKINQAAKNYDMPPEPLGRIPTSTAGVSSNKLSRAEIKAKYRV